MTSVITSRNIGRFSQNRRRRAIYSPGKQSKVAQGNVSERHIHSPGNSKCLLCSSLCVSSHNAHVSAHSSKSGLKGS
ncbi:hypothetical protein R3I94_011347 [Phoxinus phoxinus]